MDLLMAHDSLTLRMKKTRRTKRGKGRKGISGVVGRLSRRRVNMSSAFGLSFTIPVSRTHNEALMDIKLLMHSRYQYQHFQRCLIWPNPSLRHRWLKNKSSGYSPH